jgi:transposase
MKRFTEGQARDQVTLLPECLEDWADENNPVRVIDAFVEALDLGKLGFAGIDPKATGRPAYHPAILLKRRGQVAHNCARCRVSQRGAI